MCNLCQGSNGFDGVDVESSSKESGGGKSDSTNVTNISDMATSFNNSPYYASFLNQNFNTNPFVAENTIRNLSDLSDVSITEPERETNPKPNPFKVPTSSSPLSASVHSSSNSSSSLKPAKRFDPSKNVISPNGSNLSTSPLNTQISNPSQLTMYGVRPGGSLNFPSVSDHPKRPIASLASETKAIFKDEIKRSSFDAFTLSPDNSLNTRQRFTSASMDCSKGISYPNRAASPSEIASIISKSLEEGRRPSERSGSDLSRGSRGQPPFHDKRSPKVAEQPTNKLSNLDINQANRYMEEQSIPFNSWKTRFRLPRIYVIEKVNHEILQFSSQQAGDKGFLKQLSEFRKSLMDIDDAIIFDGCCRFQDFDQTLQTSISRDECDASQRAHRSSQSTPNSNQMSHKALLKKSASSESRYELVSTSPLKIFKAPPSRQWIPVICQALNLNLQPDPNAAEDKASKVSKKTKVTVVYDVSLSKDKTTPVRTKYIKKTYFDLGYFVNEMTFFQFAHHPHIPKPLCIEYGDHPSIILEHVPGETIGEAFYNLGASFRFQLNSANYNQLIQEFTQMMGHVFAKLYVTLKYIHSLGFIHSDFKPGNILYDLESGKITVVDFDLCVAAPYVYSGRGTATIVAPELNGFLEGPVHFGIDWWAFGCTAAISMSRGLASFLSGRISEDDETALETFIPFFYDVDTKIYKMTPIPDHFPPLTRSFLYPFFSPDPSKRSFIGSEADHFIKSHLFFPSSINWFEYENNHTSLYSSIPPYLIGFIKYSRNPQLLKSVSHLKEIFYTITNFIGLGKPTATKDKSSSESYSGSNDEALSDGDVAESASLESDNEEKSGSEAKEEQEELNSSSGAEDEEEHETGYEADSGSISECDNENENDGKKR